MIFIEPTQSSPKIYFDKDKSFLIITGESYPENSFEFYRPVFDWLENELSNLKKLTVKLNISYMNSSSIKCMLDIMDILTEKHQEGMDIKLLWYYDAENDRALDLAEEFTEDLEIPFEIIALNDGDIV